jgi:hypothetical protein
MYRLIAPALGSNDSKVKEESANLDALVLSRHNLPTDAGTTSWFNPASISSIILQTVRITVSVAHGGTDEHLRFGTKFRKNASTSSPH